MSFFGGKSLADAFTEANDKAKIAAWFKDFSDKPDDYGIEEAHRESMKNVVTATDKFIKILSPLPFFDDQRVPAKQKVPAPVIKYRGNDVLIKTVFDVIGWVLSVVGNRTEAPTEAEYYHPLVTLYAVICRTLLKQNNGTIQPKMEAAMLQVTWFKEDDIWRVTLGGTLDDPNNKSNLKDTTKNDRAQRMLSTGLITIERYREVNETVPTLEVGQRPPSHFGHCAETLPFIFLNWFLTDVDISTIAGISILPPVLLNRLDNISYNQDMRNNFSLPNSKTTLAPPCRNCSSIVRAQFGGEETLLRFQPPSPS